MVEDITKTALKTHYSINQIKRLSPYMLDRERNIICILIDDGLLMISKKHISIIKNETIFDQNNSYWQDMRFVPLESVLIKIVREE